MRMYVCMQVERGYWENIGNQRYYFDCLGDEMQIREWGGWEDITSHHIHSHGGGGMIEQYYRNSLRKVTKQTMNPFQLYFNSLRNLDI